METLANVDDQSRVKCLIHLPEKTQLVEGFEQSTEQIFDTSVHKTCIVGIRSKMSLNHIK